MAKKVLCSSHVPWIPDRPSSGSLVMLTAIGCASSKVNCLASTASRRRDLRRTRGDQRVHCASMLKVDASDLALTREALYRTLSLERTASGHVAATPPSAASNSRRPMVTVIRPSRARCVKGNDTTLRVCSLAVQGGQNTGCFRPLSWASGVIAAVLPGRARPLALVRSLAGDTTRAPVTLHQVSL